MKVNSLADILLAPQRQEALAADLVQLIEQRVAAARGLRGMSLRTGLAMLKAARPDMVPRAVARFLPDFARALEPLFRRHLESDSSDFGAFLREHPHETAAALMGMADGRVRASSNPTVHSYYKRFRGAAEAEVEGAVPGLAEVLDRHLRVAATNLTAHRA